MKNFSVLHKHFLYDLLGPDLPDLLWKGIEPCHQAAVLLLGQFSCFFSGPRPYKSPVLKAFIEKKESCSFPKKLFRCFSYSDRIKKNIYESCYDLDSIGISYLRKAIQFFDKLIIILPFRKICCCSISSLAFFNCSSFHFCIRICVNPS